MEKIKVLFFVDRLLVGGIQSLLYNWVTHIDNTKIQIDFLILDDGNVYELEEKIKKQGFTIYKLDNIWIRNPYDLIKQAQALDNFFKIHYDYKVLHMHSTSKNYLVLKYAKKYGIPIRIAHSHSLNFQTNSIFKKMIGNIMKPLLINNSTDYFACSEAAGKWMFGKKITQSKSFKVIHNAIDYSKFGFNVKTRENVRNDLNLKSSDIVIGHIGRFEKPKNHSFLIDVFYQVQKKNKDYKLLLVGTGTLVNEIKNKVEKYNISNKVIFTGYRDDVYRLVQAMDIFAFPSLFEGLGLGLVEAQASGIPCIATKKAIPKEVKLNDNFYFLDLDIDQWTNQILKMDIQRVDSYDNLKKEEYLLEDVIRYLEDFYLR